MRHSKTVSTIYIQYGTVVYLFISGLRAYLPASARGFVAGVQGHAPVADSSGLSLSREREEIGIGSSLPTWYLTDSLSLSLSRVRTMPYMT